MASPVPSQSTIQTALRSFLLAALPTGIEVVEGQDNRVPEPTGTDFVIFTAITRDRLAVGWKVYSDVLYTGSIATNVMTVTAISYGSIAVGSSVFGVGVTVPTTITSQLTGTTGGIGTYQLSSSQTIGSENLASGNVIVTQPTKIRFQLDFHSANVGDAADMVSTISTLFRDGVAVDYFDSLGTGVSPLYHDPPRQMPFINAESQFETRWIMDVYVQGYQAVPWQQQFFAPIVGPKFYPIQ